MEIRIFNNLHATNLDPTPPRRICWKHTSLMLFCFIHPNFCNPNPDGQFLDNGNDSLSVFWRKSEKTNVSYIYLFCPADFLAPCSWALLSLVTLTYFCLAVAAPLVPEIVWFCRGPIPWRAVSSVSSSPLPPSVEPRGEIPAPRSLFPPSPS